MMLIILIAHCHCLYLCDSLASNSQELSLKVTEKNNGSVCIISSHFERLYTCFHVLAFFSQGQFSMRPPSGSRGVALGKYQSSEVHINKGITLELFCLHSFCFFTYDPDVGVCCISSYDFFFFFIQCFMYMGEGGAAKYKKYLQ